MRTLWRDDVASFDGEFVSFDSVRVNPKPLPTAVFRSCSVVTAMRRCAEWSRGADGWYGFNLDGVRQVAERIEFLRRHVRRAVAATATTCGWQWRCAT